MRPHKVGQGKCRIRLADEQGSSLLKPGHMLSGEIVVGQQTATVRVSFQRLVVQFAVQIVHGHIRPEEIQRLLEQVHPGIQIGGTVIAVYHRHRFSGGRRHHIDLLISL